MKAWNSGIWMGKANLDPSPWPTYVRDPAIYTSNSLKIRKRKPLDNFSLHAPCSILFVMVSSKMARTKAWLQMGPVLDT